MAALRCRWLSEGLLAIPFELCLSGSSTIRFEVTLFDMNLGFEMGVGILTSWYCVRISAQVLCFNAFRESEKKSYGHLLGFRCFVSRSSGCSMYAMVQEKRMNVKLRG